MARQLRGLGYARASAAITEWLPGDVAGDEHLQHLRDALRRTADASELPESARHRAAHLGAVSLSLPGAIGRCGTVFVAWFEPRRARDRGAYPAQYEAHWEETPVGGGFLEEAPPTTEIQAVLAWARERADRVYVRPRWAPDTYYWAGDPTLRPPDVPLLRVPS